MTLPIRFGWCVQIGVDDGTRTHDDRIHNPGLYLLSYAHHGSIINPINRPEYGAPGRTRTCNPRLSLPATAFAALPTQVCGLDYLFAVSGAARIVSTDPCEGFHGVAISVIC